MRIFGHQLSHLLMLKPAAFAFLNNPGIGSSNGKLWLNANRPAQATKNALIYNH